MGLRAPFVESTNQMIFGCFFIYGYVLNGRDDAKDHLRYQLKGLLKRLRNMSHVSRTLNSVPDYNLWSITTLKLCYPTVELEAIVSKHGHAGAVYGIFK